MNDDFLKFAISRIDTISTEELREIMTNESTSATEAQPDAISEIKRRLKVLISNADSMQEGYAWALAMVEIVEQEFAGAARDLDVEAERREFEESCPGLNPLRYGEERAYAYCSPVVEYHWQGWLAKAKSLARSAAQGGTNADYQPDSSK